jgi:Fanconi anemia group M protein
MIQFTPRSYQQSILETAKRANTLVVLPTGVGKTLIAIMLAAHRMKEHPATKALILAPTKPLVEQHLESFKEQLPELFADLQLFTGEIPSQERKKIWRTADIIFSTPQCIANDIARGFYDLSEVSLLVIDEAHRCLKNYDYTKVVSRYKSQAQHPKILGLTASPGSDVDIVKQICEHLSIDEVEIRSRESEDVKPYIHELDFNKVEVPFPQEFIEIRVLLRRIYDTKTEQLKRMNLLFGPANKITLLKLQTHLARQATQGSGAAMAGMSLCAQAIKISHAIELLETQTLSSLHTYMKELISQAEQKKSKGVQNLVKMPEFNAALLSLTQLIGHKTEHPKLGEIAHIVEEEFKKAENPKILIFTQFRDTAATLVNTLNQNERIKAALFIGQASNTRTKGLSQKEQKEIIEQFREGTINVLCATSIGEEGLDIPEVNAVIFYEPIPSAIRKIQRAGRTARHAPGKLFILVTKGTRDEINHYASSAREKKMYKTIDTVKQHLRNRPKPENKSIKDYF